MSAIVYDYAEINKALLGDDWWQPKVVDNKTAQPSTPAEPPPVRYVLIPVKSLKR